MARDILDQVPVVEDTPRLNKKFIIGIDPGRNGGIVGLTNGHINVIDKMPQATSDLWGYFVNVLSIPMIGKENISVYIEDVHSMPSDGVRAAFTFGRHLGNLDMVMVRWDLDIVRVILSKWMDFYKIKRDKEESRYNYKKRLVEIAKGLAPTSHRDKINLHTADAFLIAKWGWEQEKQLRKSNNDN